MYFGDIIFLCYELGTGVAEISYYMMFFMLLTVWLYLAVFGLSKNYMRRKVKCNVPFEKRINQNAAIINFPFFWNMKTEQCEILNIQKIG